MALSRARARGKPSPLSLAAQAPDRPAVPRVEIRLPRPISKNNLRSYGRGRPYTSAEYAAWKEACGWAIQLHRPKLGRIAGPYSLHIRLCATETRIDLGNAEQALSDLMQTHGLIDNDRKAQSITSDWGADTGVIVILEKAEGQPDSPALDQRGGR